MVGRTRITRPVSPRQPVDRANPLARAITAGVSVNRRAMGFEDSNAPVSESLQNEQARAFLGFIRAGAQSGAVDGLQTLENYYPSVGIARRLAAHPALHGVVRDFVQWMAVPEDLRPYVLQELKLADIDLDANDRPSAELLTPRAPQSQDHNAFAPIVERRLPTPEVGSFVVPTGPVAKGWSGGIDYPALAETDPRSFFSTAATDENLKKLVGRDQKRSLPAEWVKHLGGDQSFSYADLLNFTARRFELAARVRFEDRVPWDARHSSTAGKSYLSYDVTPYHPDNVLPLLRLAKALGADPNWVWMRKEDRSVVRLKDVAEALNLPKHEEDAAEFDVDQALAAFDAARAVDDRSKLEALVALQGTQADAASFGDLVEGARSLLVRGSFAPLKSAALSAQETAQLVDALLADGHLGVATVLAGLFGGIERQPLADALKAAGLASDLEAEQWASSAETLQKLSPSDALFATDGLVEHPPDFVLLPLRLALAQAENLSEQELKALFDTWRDRGTAPVLRVMADWAALRGESQAQPIGEVIEHALEAGTLTAEELQAALAGGRATAFSAERHLESLLQHAREVVTASPADKARAAEALIEALDGGSTKLPLEHAAVQVLRAVHAQELRLITPLDDADIRLGGVEPNLGLPANLSERFQRAVSAQVEWLPASSEGPTSFARIEGVPSIEGIDSPGSTEGRLAQHALKLLRARLELLASSRFTNGQRFAVDVAAAEAQALEVVEGTLGPELARAQGVEAKMAVYAHGRSMLEGFSTWLEALTDRADG